MIADWFGLDLAATAALLHRGQPGSGDIPAHQGGRVPVGRYGGGLLATHLSGSLRTGKTLFCQETSGTDLSASEHTEYFDFYQSNRELADPDIYTVTICLHWEAIGIYTCHETDAEPDITMVQPEGPVRPQPSGRSAGSWYYPETWCQ